MLNIFTIAYQAMPHIARHLEVFSRLRVPWHWSIVYGLADPVHDTAWCKWIADQPDDGTLEYVLGITGYPVTLQRAARWPGKTAMVNAALTAFTEPGILVEIDADEYWRADQLEAVEPLFGIYPLCDTAAFYCRCFVGPRRVVSTPGTWGNHVNYEWFRAWRWKPGEKFKTHEPPMLEGHNKLIMHPATAAAGLVFDHHAYSGEAQVAFKEKYYGYTGAVHAWKRLCAVRGPANPREYLPWVKEDVVSYELP